MGMDLLDFTFRVEKAFGIKVPRDAYIDRLPDRPRFEATAGEMHDLVVQLCREQGVQVPFSSWSRIKKLLAEVTLKSPTLIHRDTWLVKELGFST